MSESAGMPYYPIADIPDEATADCEAIAYEFTGAVQPHAALIVLDARTLRILQASRSTTSILHAPPELLLNATFDAELIGCSPPLTIPWDELREGRVRDFRFEFEHHSNSVKLMLRAHSAGDRFLVSLEPSSSEIDISERLIPDLLPTLLDALSSVSQVSDAANCAADAIRCALGYDRTIVYRFDENWNGEVIAESFDDATLEPFLGLKFPATDIPRSARRLYKNCKMRHVVDTQAPPAQLEPLLDPLSQQNTDLSHLTIRSSAASCREFYGNMAVRSTCVLPILVSGNIWGHVSCFHSVPRRIPVQCERTLHAAAQVFAQTVASIELSHRVSAEQKALQVQHDLASKYRSATEQPNQLRDSIKSLMTLLQADRACLILENEVISVGSALPPELMGQLLAELRAKSVDRSFSSDCLKRDLPSVLLDVSDIAGVLAVPLDPMWEEAFVLFRNTRHETTRWAGDPREGLRWDQQGRPGMRPRASFATYLANTESSSAPWSEDERLIANSCSMVLGLQLLRMKAQAARKAQQSFLANMSHEIRTPMTAILGYIDLLDDKDLDELESKEAFEIVRRNGEHLLSLINDILDLSKIQTGQLTLESCSLSPRDLVQDVVGLLMHQAETKHTKLDFTIGESVPKMLLSDPTRLRQILVNLVSNAIKFTEKGAVDIAVEFDLETSTLSVQVRDTGIGLSNAQLEAIREFRPFRQADVSTTRKFGGTGLGLAICKSLIELLDGTIDVQSQEGVGSIFTVSIPAQCEEQKTTVPETKTSTALTSVAGKSTGGKPLEDLRILLVEDGLDNQRLIKFLLSKAGAAVELAENGQVAIAMIQAEAKKPRGFDIVLMDLQMPIMDGYQATRQLREMNYLNPIIALSAHAIAGARDEAIEAGCNDYCVKPIKKEDLFKACRSFSGR
jgi:light-regulated signal transduction histidine kinase (bacteriophytochrome)/CheY-like chemotaxis protein